ncbi:MAG: PIN domain-containing protein [Hyphomicrobiaceae bacterium]
MSAAFFDTNIIAYAADSAAEETAKRDAARRLMLTRSVTISTQVMLELYAVLRKRLGYSAETARDWVGALQDDTVVEMTARDVLQAITIARRHDISHWDGLILVAAEKSGVEIVYTEDLNHGQIYGNVRVCNPFIEDFLAAS